MFTLHCNAQCGKTRNSLHASQIFFPSNQFVIKFFSKMLIWRNFCDKTVAAKFRNFHSVHCAVGDLKISFFTKFLLISTLHCALQCKRATTLWILRNFCTYHDFLKNFRENNFISKDKEFYCKIDFTK